MTEQRPSSDAITRAIELYQRGFARPAIDVLEAEARRQPDDGRLWRMRGVLLAREGRLDEAFDNIQRALVLVPLGYEGLLVLAGGYARLGKNELAAGMADELASDQHFPAELWEPLYALLCGLGSSQSALQFCLRMIDRRPDDDLLCFATARALRRAGRPPEHAAALLHKAVELNPQDVRYRVSLALLLMQLRREVEARQQVARLAPYDLAAIECRCCLQKLLPMYLQLGDGERAAAAARRLAELTSKQRGASNEIASS